MNIFGFAILVCLFQCAQFLFAGKSNCSDGPCKGYIITVKDEYVKCSKNNRVTVAKNITAVLSADCKLNIDICFNVLKGFKSGKVDYSISPALVPLPITDKDRDLGELMTQLGISGNYTYPIQNPGVYCSSPDKALDLCRYSGLISFAVGNNTGHVDVYFDGDRRADTYDVTVNIAKAK